MKDEFLENLEKIDVKPGDTVVLGVSGGVDSITLLDLLANKDLGLDIIVAHLNHGLRKEADDDELFVMDLAANYGLKSVSEKISPPKTGNLEEEFRNLRRVFLQEVAKEFNAKYIALAHNQNDQAETFVFNLLRGSGPNGLSAMKMKDKKIIRPLLNISREEIESYAKSSMLKWREDVTNLDTRYSRNYIRHEILPLFFKLNPSYLNAISNQSNLQGKINELLENEAEKYLGSDAKTLSTLDDPVLFEVVAILFEKAKGDRKDFTIQNFYDIKNLLSRTSGTKEVTLPGKIIAKRSYDKLEIFRKIVDNTSSVPEEIVLVLGENAFGDWKITANVACDQTVQADSLEIDNLDDIVIRGWKSGDRISTNSGTKKLQDLFTNAKIERSERIFWPVVASKTNEILWVPNLAKNKNLKKGGIKIIAEKG